MLVTLGWIIWVLVVLFAARALYQAIRPHIAGNEHDMYFRIAAGLLVIAVIPGLLLTTLGGWAKLHLLWMIPASYVALCVALCLVAFPIVWLVYRVKKQGYRLRQQQGTP
jgi:hypothetical protein